MTDTTNTLRSTFNHFVRQFHGTSSNETAPLTWTHDRVNPGVIDVDEVQCTTSFAESLGLQGTDPTTAHNAPIVARTLEQYQSNMEKTRQRLVDEELAPSVLREVPFAYDSSKLPRAVQQVLPLLLEIAALTEQLRLLQVDHKGIQWQQDVAAQAQAGETASQSLFARGAIIACHFNKSPLCKPHAHFPNTDPNLSMWPDRITFDEQGTIVNALGKRADAQAVLSPFTSVYVDAPNFDASTDPSTWPLRTLAYQQDTLYRPLLLKIAERFEKVATSPGFAQAEPEFAQVARAQAKAIRDHGGSAPWDEAEMIWAKARGKHIAWAWGPLEESQPPYVKRVFQMHIFTVRDESTRPFQYALPLMEAELAKHTASYEARKEISVDSVVQVYDVIARTGGINSPAGEALAEILPNSGPVQDAGIPKRQIFANIQEAVFDTICGDLAKLAFVPEQAHLVDSKVFSNSGAGHENAHAVGPRKDRLVTVNGREVPANKAMGANLHYTIEEAKSDLGGLLMAHIWHEHGIVSEEYVKKANVTFVMGRIRQQRFGGAHGGGSAGQFGALFAQGAATMEQRVINGATQTRIKVHHDKMRAFALNNMVAIAEAQAVGSKAQGQAFLDLSKQIPAVYESEFVPRFAAAGIPRHIQIMPHDIAKK